MQRSEPRLPNAVPTQYELDQVRIAKQHNNKLAELVGEQSCISGITAPPTIIITKMPEP